MSEKNITVGTVENKVATRELTRNSENFVCPAVDILEKGDALLVYADLPGVTKEGLGISVASGILTIEGKSDYQFTPDPLIKEFNPVNFYRQFELPDTFDLDKISAELKNGVLAVRLPKKEEMKPRKIQVSVS